MALTTGYVNKIESFILLCLCASKGAARRLLGQGGGYINNERITAFDHRFDITENKIILRAGKKKFHRIIVE